MYSSWDVQVLAALFSGVKLEVYWFYCLFCCFLFYFEGTHGGYSEESGGWFNGPGLWYLQGEGVLLISIGKQPHYMESKTPSLFTKYIR